MVLIPLTMFVFAIFEFGWLLMNWNLLNNAAREGCRYALANNTSSTITTDVQTTVTTFMAGTSANFTNFTVTMGGTQASTGTTVSGTTSGINSLAAGDLISVKVSGKFRVLNVIPYFTMPAITLTSNVTMVCEGAT